ncbi:MAG: FAD-dependent oxidoreductase [Eggerthellaceae bacterium]|nr:FAD-dependent oxidoreductase [Eggerthellaceae bacterium]
MGGKVIVVGAGAAGIYATWLLRRQGVDVTCFEASPYPCGRTRAYEKDGYICETGALGVETQWDFEPQLIKDVGLSGEYAAGTTMRVGFWRKNRLNLVGIGTAAQQLSWLRETLGFRGIPLKAIRQAIKVALAINKELKQIEAQGKDVHANSFEALLPFGDVRLDEYVLEHGGKEALDYIFQPFMSLMILGSAPDTCVTHMMCLFINNSQGMSESGGFGWMKRGIGSIYEAAYGMDEECYRLSCPVDEIVIEDGAVTGVRAGGEFFPADHVICCTTASKVAQITPELPQAIADDLACVRYASTYHYMFGDRKKFTPDEFTMEFFASTPEDPKPLIRVCLDAAQRSDAYTPYGREKGTLLHVLTSYEHEERLMAMSDEERLKLVMDETRKLFPDMPEDLELCECLYLPEAISLDAPGQMPAMHDYETNHLDDVRGFHLAGEYLHPAASAEGACITARRAAGRVLEQMGMPGLPGCKAESAAPAPKASAKDVAVPAGTAVAGFAAGVAIGRRTK